MNHHWESQPLESPWGRPGLRIVDAARTSGDLAACVSLTVVAATATLLTQGSGLRLLVVLPFLMTVPGYLLLQALIVPAAPALVRWLHALIGFGISPAVLGLLALATSIVPDGFRSSAIIATVALACLGLAAIAFLRRSTHAEPAHPAPHVAA